MNTTDMDHPLNRKKIQRLLTLGVIGSVLTGIGDFLLGYGEAAAAGGAGLAGVLMANAPKLSDAQLICGGLLGMIGLPLEGVGCFGICRLMAFAPRRSVRIYRASILGYLCLAPIGCHMNIGVLNIAYKRLLPLGAGAASDAANLLLGAFYVPVWILLILFWLPGMIVQFRSFARGCTPCPARAKWFCVPVGMWPALLFSMIAGPDTALGGGVGTMFLSFGNLFMFAGLLFTLPEEKRLSEFRMSGACSPILKKS